MTKKMLIDASLPEETRLVIARGQHIEAFETETKQQIKNNIYLAQITRVESSLQAAFVEYGGNRHGFLAFSEIHPDYFHIPVGDRPAEEMPSHDAPDPGRDEEAEKADQLETSEASEVYDSPQDLMPADDDRFSYAMPENIEEESDAAKPSPSAKTERPHQKYNIQEVIKRRQVLLVQVVKEERGNKGAALTTFLSLAGRYCVLMPNTDRSSGVSRKISSRDMRSKLRDIASSLTVPEGMSVILRTAGANLTQSEIERDLEYLMRLWENIRALTLKSAAPVLIYEEGNLIHRALRDLLKKDINEIQIEGEQAYQQAKNFLTTLMPNALDILFQHKENEPLFSHYGIEESLDNINVPTVQLKSGGYIVINPTEALVAIDVNSGRATSEHSIEDTAFKNNLEAADEIARQARLRDLAGLIVIDFIDMENARNVREVEKRMRDAVRQDPARVQLGRISHNFGLFEMSRQRLRPELSAGRMEACPQCNGSGQTLTAQTIALRALRAAVGQAARAGGENNETTLRLNWPVVLYILNHKRDELLQIEQKHGLKIKIEAGGIDNPDQPWLIETKKFIHPEKPVNEHDAINVETVYAQMPSAPQAPRAQASNPQETSRRRGRRRSKQNKQRSPAQGQNASSKMQKGAKHAQQRKNQTAQPAKKPSLWQRLTGQK